MALLHVQHLMKTFPARYSWFGTLKNPEVVAVNAISFALAEGEILGFLGPNGSGKTTTIQMLLSLTQPTSGNITYFDKDFLKHRSEILKQVGFASSFVRLPGQLTVYENLNFYGTLYGMTSNERKQSIESYLKYVDLWHMRDLATHGLSSGEAARLILAKACMIRPRVILLDELTAALDPRAAQDVRNLILEQRNTYGTAILFTSHNMVEVTQICDRVLVLKKGIIIADNTPEQLANSVSMTTVQLFISEGLDIAIKYAEDHQIPYRQEGHDIELALHEKDIATVLNALAMLAVHYSQITINKPQLEDYFLYISAKA